MDANEGGTGCEGAPTVHPPVSTAVDARVAKLEADQKSVRADLDVRADQLSRASRRGKHDPWVIVGRAVVGDLRRRDALISEELAQLREP
jgi:hypothetical protein